MFGIRDATYTALNLWPAADYGIDPSPDAA
jgi:hypothetical protein